MPELPEVETVKRGLQIFLPGKVVAKVHHNWHKSFPNAENDVQQFLIDSTITDVERRAKVLLIHLNTHYSLVIHLKMTGQLVFKSETDRFGAGHPTDSLIHKLPDRSTHVWFDFTDGSHLFFNDQRKFGWVRLLPTVAIQELDFFKKVGPEPLANDFTLDEWNGRLDRRAKSGIKAVLLDQTVIAGVGNIYADESLWAAKIHPSTRVMDIPVSKRALLYTKLREILLLAIEKGGSTDKNYVNAEGKKGSYMSFAKVFRREGQPCPRCGTTIEKIRVAGRGTHICPTCQKLS